MSESLETRLFLTVTLHYVPDAEQLELSAGAESLFCTKYDLLSGPPVQNLAAAIQPPNLIAFNAEGFPRPGIRRLVDPDSTATVNVNSSKIDPGSSYFRAGLLNETGRLLYEGQWVAANSKDASLIPIYNLQPEPDRFPPRGCVGKQEVGPCSVLLHSGEYRHQEVDLVIPGRGLNWAFSRTYRSGFTYDGPLGHNWDFEDNRRLVVVDPINLATMRSAFQFIDVGSVVRMDGQGRVDRYELSPVGIFRPPNGSFTNLHKNVDGTYTERYRNGDTIRYDLPDGRGIARMTSQSDRKGNIIEYFYDAGNRLERVVDSLGRPIQYFYDSNNRIQEVRDFVNRSLRFTYDNDGNLAAVTSPIVMGTTNGNDFPNGKTTKYTYSSGFSTELPNHNLIAITAPNEVATGGEPRMVVTYGTQMASPDMDRVFTRTVGTTDRNGVQVGGTNEYYYHNLGPVAPDDYVSPVMKTTVQDRHGDTTDYTFNQRGNNLSIREHTPHTNSGSDLPFYGSRFSYNDDAQLISAELSEGVRMHYQLDENSEQRFQQANVVKVTRTLNVDRSGESSNAHTALEYEPIYNQIHKYIEEQSRFFTYKPRDSGENWMEPDTTTYTYDFQEGTDFVSLGLEVGLDALEVQVLLAEQGISMNLGDVNGDGRTDQIVGNVVRIEHPAATLLEAFPQSTVTDVRLQPSEELYRYNDFGQLAHQVDSAGHVTEYHYYPERDPNGDGIPDNPFGDETTGGYLREITKGRVSEDSGNLDPNLTPPSIHMEYEYDPVGNRTREIDRHGMVTEYTVNELNQVLQITRLVTHEVDVIDGLEPVASIPPEDSPYVEWIFYDFNDNVVRRLVKNRGATSNVEVYGDIDGDNDVDVDDVHELFAAIGQPADFRRDLQFDGILDRRDVVFLVKHILQLTDGDYDGNGKVDINDLNFVLFNWGAGSDTLSTDWIHQRPLESSAIGFDELNNVLVNWGNLGVPPEPQSFVEFWYRYDILDNLVQTSEEINANQFLITGYPHDSNDKQMLGIIPDGNATGTNYHNGDLEVLTKEDKLLPTAASEVGEPRVAGFLTDDEALVNELLFEEVFSQMDKDVVFDLLLENGFLNDEITSRPDLMSRLKQKPGFEDVEDFQLTNFGWLTAINDLRGEGTLFNKTRFFSKGNGFHHEVMMSWLVVDELKLLFENQRELFLEDFNAEELAILLDLPSDARPNPLEVDPLYLGAWSWRAMVYDDDGSQIFLDGNSPYMRTWLDLGNSKDLITLMDPIVCPVFVGCNQRYINWTINSFNGLPPEQRILNIKNKSIWSHPEFVTSNVSHRLQHDLDPLRDKNAPDRVVVRYPEIHENLLPFVYGALVQESVSYDIDVSLNVIAIEKRNGLTNDKLSFEVDFARGRVAIIHNREQTRYARSEHDREYRLALHEVAQLISDVESALLETKGWSRRRIDEMGTARNLVYRELEAITLDQINIDYSDQGVLYTLATLAPNIWLVRHKEGSDETIYQLDSTEQLITVTQNNDQGTVATTLVSGQWMEYRHQILEMQTVVEQVRDTFGSHEASFLTLSSNEKAALNLFVVAEILSRRIAQETFPYYYPSMEEWVGLMQQHWEPIFEEMADRVHGHIPLAIADYEVSGISFLWFMDQFRTYKDDGVLLYDATPVTNDPHYEEDQFFDLIGNGPSFEGQEVFGRDTYGKLSTTSHAMKFNAWILERRNESFQAGVFNVLRRYFPGMKFSQWLTSLRSDLVPYKFHFESIFDLLGLGQYSPDLYLNTAVYGVVPHRFISKPKMLTESWSYANPTPTNVNQLGAHNNAYYSHFTAAVNLIHRMNAVSLGSDIEVSHWLAPPSVTRRDGAFFGVDAYWDATCLCVLNGEFLGSTYAEAYFRAAANAGAIQGWLPRSSMNLEDQEFVHRVVGEINELFGYRDRDVLHDAWVEVNGEKMSVGPGQDLMHQKNFAIWASEGLGLEPGKVGHVFRVVMDLDKLEEGQTRWDLVRNDGTDGMPVVIELQDDRLAIPGARIFIPAGVTNEYKLFEVVNDGSDGKDVVLRVFGDELKLNNARVIAGGKFPGDYLTIEQDERVYHFNEAVLTEEQSVDPTTVQFQRIRTIRHSPTDVVNNGLDGQPVVINVREVHKRGFWVVQDPARANLPVDPPTTSMVSRYGLATKL